MTLYDFDPAAKRWAKKEVEGPLFVVKRGSDPRFQFVILNRLGTRNLVEDVLGDFEFELKEPYLLYKSSRNEVNGIWFYKPKECREVEALLMKLRRTYGGSLAAPAAPPAAVPAPAPAAPAPTPTDDISSLLGMIDSMGPQAAQAPQPPPPQPRPRPAAPKAAKPDMGAVKILKRGDGNGAAGAAGEAGAGRPGAATPAPAEGRGSPPKAKERKAGVGGPSAPFSKEHVKVALRALMEKEEVVNLFYKELVKAVKRPTTER